ncbi:MAG: hypothetical protein IT582_00995 [Opitutaceae bacterium]|nr:hypothetical protein [Opitutaceae bacterium]
MIEADAILRKMVAGMFTAEGYRVIDAANPEDARRLTDAASKPVQLLIATLDRDGEKLARVLHQNSALRVLDTCQRKAWRTLPWLPAGHQTALPRPFSLNQLLKAARRTLDA